MQLIWLNAAGSVLCRGEEVRSSHNLTCDYEAIAYYDTDEERSVAPVDVEGHQLLYRARRGGLYDPDRGRQTVNALNEPILRRIEKSGLFHPEKGMAEHDGI